MNPGGQSVPFGVPMPPGGNSSNIPPPPPRGNNGNMRGGGRGGGRGGRGGRRPNFGGANGGRGGGHGGRGRGRGRGGRGNNNNNNMRNMNRYGPNNGGGGNGNAPPPPPPPPQGMNNGNMRNNHNWRGNGGRNGPSGRNNSTRFSGRGGRGGGRGHGPGGHGHGGHGHGSPMGNMKGRGNGNFHQQQFHPGPAGQGHFPNGPPNQQQGHVPPPPPHSNYGGPMQHQQHQHLNPMMRGGPPPPPPPPNQSGFQHQQNMRHPQHQSSIPPPPPKQQQNMMHAPQWQGQGSMPSTQFQSQQQQQQYPPQNGHHTNFSQQQQVQIQPQFPGGQAPTQHHHQQQQQQTQMHQVQPMSSVNKNQYQQQQQTSHHQLQQHQTSTPQVAYGQQAQQQQFPLARQSSTSTAVSQITDPEQIPENWSTHKAPSGINYFFNKLTNRSTYDQPACLLSNGGTSQTSATINPTAVAASQSKERGWTQHTDKATNKVYYYNGVTTTWDKPKDFVDSSSADQESSPAQPKKKRKKDNEKIVAVSLYSNKAEAVAAFKGLLLAKDISPTMKWNDVMKICSSDNRWNACNSAGERKQALAEYQTKRASELREQKRQEKVRAKDAFMALLTDILPSVRSFNPSANTRFEDIRDSLSTDDRFYAVEDEETRHDLYFDFVEELRKRDERQRRGRKREAKDNFLAFLKSREEIGSLTFASTWSAFILTLNDEDKENPHFAVSSAMSDSDRQLYFADYVIELNAAEEEKKRRILDARRRAEKAQRNAYREALRSMAKESKILPSSRWRNCEEELITHESFGPVNDQDKNAPRDMFEDFVYDWADDYRRDKSFLNSLIESSKDAVVNAETKYDDFKETILKAAAYSPDLYSDARRVINGEDPVSSAKLYFDEIVLRAKNGNAMLSKRRGPYGRRNDDSSEDEGEIVEEDGQVSEETSKTVKEEGES
jgi:pre-mRNA-processing factor 40